QLQAAAASFAAGDTTAGVHQLEAFIHHVRAQSDQSGHHIDAHIDAGLAAQLIFSAQQIIDAMECGGNKPPRTTRTPRQAEGKEGSASGSAFLCVLGVLGGSRGPAPEELRSAPRGVTVPKTYGSIMAQS